MHVRQMRSGPWLVIVQVKGQRSSTKVATRQEAVNVGRIATLLQGCDPDGRAPTLDDYIEPRGKACWPWRGSMGHDGYGRWKGQTAHRVVYEKFVGPIPDGLTIDHVCRNRGCINPAHLEAVTQAENNRRKPPRSCNDEKRKSRTPTY